MNDTPTKRNTVRLVFLIVVLVSSLFLLAYQTTTISNLFTSKELTPAKVQCAFRKLKGMQTGSVSVTGIRAGQNYAGYIIADVVLTNFNWTDGGRSCPPYNGPAVGGFTGYTNGTYTLKEVQLTEVTSSSGNQPSFSVDANTLD